jgi:hypothetical protein
MVETGAATERRADLRQDNLAIAVDQVMPVFRASGLPKSICTIQAPAASNTGAPSGAYANVFGLVNIASQDAPENTGSGLSANEAKRPAETISDGSRHILLDAYYPLLSPATNWGDVGWIAVVDGVAYDIRGAEADSQRTQTRLRLCKVTV